MNNTVKRNTLLYRSKWASIALYPASAIVGTKRVVGSLPQIAPCDCEGGVFPAAVRLTNFSAIDFSKMAEDAAKIQTYIVNGGKQDDLSGAKFIKPSGLFNNRAKRR